MPELPEVETVRRGLAPVLEGARLKRVEQRRADLRIPFPDGFVQHLSGRTVTKVGRRAKYLVIDLDSGHALIWHLGMSGQVRIYPVGEVVPEPGKHDHVIFETEAGATIVYRDPRRFGLMTLTEDSSTHRLLKDFGPEPGQGNIDGVLLGARLKGRKSSIKTVLLDQSVIAGLGNIYVCEALFRAGISPKRSAHTVQGARAAKLAVAIEAVIKEAIAAGGSTLSDHRQTDGTLGYFQHTFAAYGRENEPCSVCGTPIKRITQSGRSTFYCPTCQR